MNFLHISSLQIEFFKAAALKFKNLKPIGTGMSQKETNCILWVSLAASPPVTLVGHEATVPTCAAGCKRPYNHTGQETSTGRGWIKCFWETEWEDLPGLFKRTYKPDHVFWFQSQWVSPSSNQDTQHGFPEASPQRTQSAVMPDPSLIWVGRERDGGNVFRPLKLESVLFLLRNVTAMS